MSSTISNWNSQYDGRYHGINNNYEIELRIDSSLNIISGDLSILFINKDQRSPYYNQTISDHYLSFICTEPQTKEEKQIIIVNGNVTFFKNMRILGHITLNIDQNKNLYTMNLEFKDKLYNIKTTSTFFELTNKSSRFRDIDIEVDVMKGTRELPIYKDYTLKSAFAKAGINLNESINEIKILDLPDQTWDDSELHSIMNIFMEKNEDFVYPKWYLYLLIATLYINSGVLGIMYDSTDEAPRQGAAVFAKHQALDGEDLIHKRTYLFAIIHELGHAFNLHHSFQKGITTATGIPKPESLSFMNYPQLYRLGLNMPDDRNMQERAFNDFWAEFENKFSFDDEELAYIRHHDLYEVIMGGNSFESGDRYEYGHNFFDSNRRKNYNLLVRTVKENFEFGEPIMTEVRIKNVSNDLLTIPQNLNIKDQFVIANIEEPDGTKKLYKPMIRRCLYFQEKDLQPSKGEYEDLFLHYGSPVFYFKTPGRYKIQALVPSLEGILKSKSCEINVLEPQSKNESKIINSTFSRDYGHYIYLKGADHLEEIEKKLSKLKAKLDNTNFSRYVDLYRGERLSREFKDVRNGKVDRRKPSNKEATMSLNSAVKETKEDEIPFQNVTLNRTMTKLAKMYDKIGEHSKANDTRSKLVDRLKEREVMKEVIQSIEKEMKK